MHLSFSLFSFSLKIREMRSIKACFAMDERYSCRVFFFFFCSCRNFRSQIVKAKMHIELLCNLPHTIKLGQNPSDTLNVTLVYLKKMKRFTSAKNENDENLSHISRATCKMCDLHVIAWTECSLLHGRID